MDRRRLRRRRGPRGLRSSTLRPRHARGTRCAHRPMQNGYEYYDVVAMGVFARPRPKPKPCCFTTSSTGRGFVTRQLHPPGANDKAQQGAAKASANLTQTLTLTLNPTRPGARDTKASPLHYFLATAVRGQVQPLSGGLSACSGHECSKCGLPQGLGCNRGVSHRHACWPRSGGLF